MNKREKMGIANVPEFEIGNPFPCEHKKKINALLEDSYSQMLLMLA